MELAQLAHVAPELALYSFADLLVDYLVQLKVDYVFGVPGGAIEPLYDAIARHQQRGGTLSHIVARHEAGAAFMADGYARETGKLGVCISTSGPGATNMITAVATAFGNSVPMLVITGQPALASFGRHTLQESSCTGIDIVGMFSHCTRFNTLISHPAQLERKLVTAIQTATGAAPGPVHLSIPADVFRSPCGAQAPAFDVQALIDRPAMIDPNSIVALCDLVEHSSNAVLLVGGGCGDAADSIIQFAVLHGVKIITTPDGKGLIDPHHPLYRGVFGFGGHMTAEAVLRDPAVDLILAVGSSMGEWTTAGWSDSLLNNRLVHIDPCEEHLARTPMAQLHVRGSPRAVFDAIAAPRPLRFIDVPAHPDSPASAGLCDPMWNSRLMLDAPAAFDSDAAFLKPQRLMKELGELFPASTRYLADAGNSVAWATHYLQPRDRAMQKPRTRLAANWLRLTTHFAPMGWAIGAAVGTAAGAPAGPVVCITGDGSMLMSGQELSTAVANRLCVVFVVLNDSSLGMVKHGQRLGGGEQIGFELPPTDFAAVARAQGGIGHTIRTAADLQALDIKAICHHSGPTLLDVYIDPEEVPPMGSRLRVLAERS